MLIAPVYNNYLLDYLQYMNQVILASGICNLFLFRKFIFQSEHR